MKLPDRLENTSKLESVGSLSIDDKVSKAETDTQYNKRLQNDTLYRVVIREKNYWKGLEKQGGELRKFNPREYLTDFKLKLTSE